MRRILYIMVLLLMYAAVAVAQESYSELVGRYMAACGNSQFDASRVKAQLCQMAVDDGLPPVEAEVKAEVFYEKKLKPIISGVMENHMMKYVEDDELRKVVEKLETEEGRAVRAGTLALLNENTLLTLTRVMMPAVTALFNGQVPEPLSIKEVDSRYRKLFKKYLKACGDDTLFDAMVSVLKNSLSSDSDERDKEFMSRFLRYLKDNSDNLLLVMCSKCYTEEDLRFMTGLYSMKEYKGCVKASKEAIADIQKVFMRVEFE